MTRLFTLEMMPVFCRVWCSCDSIFYALFCPSPLGQDECHGIDVVLDRMHSDRHTVLSEMLNRTVGEKLPHTIWYHTLIFFRCGIYKYCCSVYRIVWYDEVQGANCARTRMELTDYWETMILIYQLRCPLLHKSLLPPQFLRTIWVVIPLESSGWETIGIATLVIYWISAIPWLFFPYAWHTVSVFLWAWWMIYWKWWIAWEQLECEGSRWWFRVAIRLSHSV